MSGETLGGRPLSIVEATPREKVDKSTNNAPTKSASKSTPQHSNNEQTTQSNQQMLHQPRVRPARKTYENATQLYIKNLEFNITVESLTATLKQYNITPLEVEIAVRRFGKFKNQSRGYGFIYVNNDELDRALQLDGKSVDGRELSVQVARTEAESSEYKKNNPRPPRTRNNRNQSQNNNNNDDNNEIPNDSRRRGRNDQE